MLLTRLRQQVTIRARTVVGGVALAVVLLGALMLLGPPVPDRPQPPPQRVGPLTALQPEVREEARPAREDLPPEPATPAPESHPSALPDSPASLEPPEPRAPLVPAPAGEAADFHRLCRTLAEAWAELRALLEATLVPGAPFPDTPLPGDLGEVPPDLPCSDWNNS